MRPPSAVILWVSLLVGQPALGRGVSRPLAFIPVETPDGTALFARTAEGWVSITPGGAEVVSVQGGRLWLSLPGAPAGDVIGEDPLPSRVSMLVGPRERWRQGLRAYARARWRRPIPGVDVVFEGRDGRLSWRFDAADGVDAAALELTSSLSFSSPVGGQQQDQALAVALDPAGDVYIAGRTSSPDFPVSAGAVGPAKPGILSAFVYKLDRVTGSPVWSTYIGGSGTDVVNAIAVDATGRPWVVGTTTSADLPVTSGVVGTVYGGAGAFQKGDAFAARLAADGSDLVVMTYLGGTGDDEGLAVAPAPDGGAVVAGATTSPDFPVKDAAQPDLGDAWGDAFVLRLGPAGGLTWSSYLGGGAGDTAYAVATDGTGAAWVAGASGSADFLTVAAFNPTPAGGGDSFLTRFSPAGAIVRSTFLGGPGSEARGLALTPGGSLIVAGSAPDGFPTAGGFQPRMAEGPCDQLWGCPDAFVARVDPAAGIVWASYLGGTSVDIANDVAVDAGGAVYVAGRTSSKDFPVVNAPQPSHGGGDYPDAFVAKVSSDGKVLFGSTYLGGNGYDEAHGIAVRGTGEAWVAGETGSDDFPVVSPAAAYRGLGDGFVARLSFGAFDGFAVTEVLPPAGGDIGVVTVLVRGYGFKPGATVRLRRQGSAEVHAIASEVGEAGTAVACVLDLANVAQGSWDVVVQNPGGPEAVLPHAFRVEPGVPASVWSDVLGRPVIRADFPEVFTILFGNAGNVDALLAVLFIDVPAGTEVEFEQPLPEVDPPPGVDAAEWDAMPRTITVGDTTRVPLVIPRLPPGRVGSVRVRVKAPFGPGSISTWAGGGLWGAGTTVYGSIEEWEQAYGCFASLLTQALNVAGMFSPIDPAMAVGCLKTVGYWGRDFAIGWPVFRLNATSGMALAAKGVAVFSECTGKAVVLGKVASVADFAFGVADLINNCRPDIAKKILGFLARLAIDPNDKAASPGAGEEAWVGPDGSLRWSVFFENLPSAGLPAREVLVTDELDPAVDLDEVALGPIAVGTEVLEPPPGARAFAGMIGPVAPGLVPATVEAGIDPATRTITWRFVAIDPATGAPPEDSLSGFLPPDTDPPAGQGSVVYTASPVAGVPTGTVVRNKASIVFDQNAAIVTPEVVNTIDASPPACTVGALAATQTKTDFEVAWKAADEGSGVLSVTVLASVDGGPLAPWVERSEAYSAVYEGKPGHSYAFACVARDRVGHASPTPASPEASTTVSLDAVSFEPDGAPDSAAPDAALEAADGQDTAIHEDSSGQAGPDAGQGEPLNPDTTAGEARPGDEASGGAGGGSGGGGCAAPAWPAPPLAVASCLLACVACLLAARPQRARPARRSVVGSAGGSWRNPDECATCSRGPCGPARVRGRHVLAGWWR